MYYFELIAYEMDNKIKEKEVTKSSPPNKPHSIYLERMLTERNADFKKFTEKYFIRLTPPQIKVLKNASKFQDQYSELNNKPKGHGLNFVLLWNEILYNFSNKEYGLPNISLYDRFFGTMVEMLPTFILQRLQGIVTKEVTKRSKETIPKTTTLTQPELPSNLHKLMDKIRNRYE